jgi:hypothetical protein
MMSPGLGIDEGQGLLSTRRRVHPAPETPHFQRRKIAQIHRSKSAEMGVKGARDEGSALIAPASETAR